MTQNMWIGRVSKHIAKKNYLCYTYGKLRHTFEQRCKQIQEQSLQIEDTI